MVKKEKITETTAEAKVSKKELNPVEKTVEKNPIIETEKKSVTRIGTMLKNMRQEKGLKIADVAKVLCIRKQYLEAIEESNYKEIPAFPYGVGFIRSYASFLGLNSGNIVELYKEETNTTDVNEVVMVEPQTTSAMPNLTYIIISLLAIAFIYGGWCFFNHSDENNVNIVSDAFDEGNNVVIVEEALDTDIESLSPTVDENAPNIEDVKENKINEPAEQVNDTIPTETVSATVETVKVKETVDPQPTTPEQEPIKLVVPNKGIFLEVVEETWVEVKNESKLYLSKVLKPGEGYTLPNDTGLILSVGKRGGVNVYVNGVKTDLTQSGKKMNIDIDEYLQSLR